MKYFYDASSYCQHIKPLSDQLSKVGSHGCDNVLLENPQYSLTLNNVLHSPKLTKNVVSMRIFIIDNKVYVEFDLFCVSMKDFQIGVSLMRWNNSSDVYPLTTTSS